MKLVFVLRHSEAANNFWGNDFDRNLTEKGVVNAKKVAQKLALENVQFDAVYCSTAKRAKQTLVSFIPILSIDTATITYQDDLYHAPEQTFYTCFNTIPESANIVLIVAHNPGITHFIQNLQLVTIHNMPTCGIFGFLAHTTNWAEIKNAQKEFLYFDEPNNK